MSIEVRFAVEHSVYEKWCDTARELGLRPSEYIKLRAMGLIGAAAPAMPPADGTAEIAEATPLVPHIRERIMAAAKRDGVTEITAGEILRLMRVLKVSKRQIYASLGSMVGSGRLRHDRATRSYHVIGEEAHNPEG